MDWKERIKAYQFPLLLVVILGLGLIWLNWGQGLDEQVEGFDAQTSSDQLTEEKNENTQREQGIEVGVIVDLKGAVLHPGVYKMNEGSRWLDVIQEAGGLTKDADEKKVNLSRKIVDEEVIYIPQIGEEMDVAYTESGIVSEGSNKISLNKASKEELLTISGIGPSKAEAIISYRNKHGKFTSVEDLTNVTGIGSKTLERIKDKIQP
jgi:competence protein ComEA